MKRFNYWMMRIERGRLALARIGKPVPREHLQAG